MFRHKLHQKGINLEAEAVVLHLIQEVGKMIVQVVIKSKYRLKQMKGCNKLKI